MSGKIAKKIKLPKFRKQESKDNLRQVDLTSRDCQEIVNSVKHTFLDSLYNPVWELKTASLVENRELQEKYRVKKSEMKEEGRKDLVDHFTFQLHRDSKAVPNIVKSGLQCRPQNYNGLGDSKMGVYVWRNADILMKIAESWGSASCVLLVFKVMIGKCKMIAPPSGSDQPTLEPTPNFDSHIPVSMPRPSDTIGSQMAKSQIYLYEYDEDTCEPTTTPRQILPYAVLIYEKPENVVVKPVSTKLDQYSIKPSERSLYRNVRAHAARDSGSQNSLPPNDPEIKESVAMSSTASVTETELCVPRLSDPRLVKKKTDTVSATSPDVNDFEYGLCVPRLTSGPPMNRDQPSDVSSRPSIPPSDPRSQLSYLTSGLKSSLYPPSYGPSDDEGDMSPEEPENNALDINAFLRKPRMPSLPPINLPYVTDTRQFREFENEPPPVPRDPRLSRRHAEPQVSRDVLDKPQDAKATHRHRSTTSHRNSSIGSEGSRKKLSLNDYKKKLSVTAQPNNKEPSTEELVSPEPLAPHHASIIANPNIHAVKYPHLRQSQLAAIANPHSDNCDEPVIKETATLNVVDRTSEPNVNSKERTSEPNVSANEAITKESSVQSIDAVSANRGVELESVTSETFTGSTLKLGNENPMYLDPRLKQYQIPGSENGDTDFRKDANDMVPKEDVVEEPDDMAKALNELSDPDDVTQSPMRVSSPEIDDPALAGAMQKLVEHSANVSLFTEALKSLQESAEMYGDKLKDPEFLVKKIAEKIEDLTRKKLENERKEKEETDKVAADKCQQESLDKEAKKVGENENKLLLDGFDENEDLDLRTLISVSLSTTGDIPSDCIMSPDIMSPDASNDASYPDTPVKCIPLETTSETAELASNSALNEAMQKTLEEFNKMESASEMDSDIRINNTRHNKKSRFSDLEPSDIPSPLKINLADIPMPPIAESSQHSGPTHEYFEPQKSSAKSAIDVMKPLPGTLGELVKNRQAKAAEKVVDSPVHVSQSDSHLSSFHGRSVSRETERYDRSSSIDRGFRGRGRGRFVTRGRHEDRHRYWESDIARRSSNSPSRRDRSGLSTGYRRVDDHKHASINLRNDNKTTENKEDINIVDEDNSCDSDNEIVANDNSNNAVHNVPPVESPKTSDRLEKLKSCPKGKNIRLDVANCFEDDENEDIDLRSGFHRPKTVLPDLKTKLSKPKPQIKFSLRCNKSATESNQTSEKRNCPIKTAKVNVTENLNHDNNQSSESKETVVSDPFGLGVVEDVDERKKQHSPELDIDIRDDFNEANKNTVENEVKHDGSEDNFQEVHMDLDSDSADEVTSQIDYFDMDFRTTENSNENSQDSTGDFDLRKTHSRSHSRSRSPQNGALFDAYALNKADSTMETDNQYGNIDWRDTKSNIKENLTTIPVRDKSTFGTMTSNSVSHGGLRNIIPSLNIADLKKLLASVCQPTSGGFQKLTAGPGSTDRCEGADSFQDDSAVEKDHLATIPGLGDSDESRGSNNETEKIGGFWSKTRSGYKNAPWNEDSETNGGYSDSMGYQSENRSTTVDLVDHSQPETCVDTEKKYSPVKDSVVRRKRNVKAILDMKSLFHSEVSRSSKLKASEGLSSEAICTHVENMTSGVSTEMASTPVRKKKYEVEDDYDDNISTPLQNISYHSALLESMEQSALKVRSDDLYDIPGTVDPMDKDLEYSEAKKKSTTQKTDKKRRLVSALSSPPAQKQSKLDEDGLLAISDSHGHEEDEDDDDDNGLVIDSDAEDDDRGLVIDLSPSNTVKSADSDQMDQSAVDQQNRTDILEDSEKATIQTTEDMASALAKSRKYMVIKLKGDTKKVNASTGKMYSESTEGSAIEVLGQPSLTVGSAIEVLCQPPKSKQPAVSPTASKRASSEPPENLIHLDSSTSSVQQTYGNNIPVLSKSSGSGTGMANSYSSFDYHKTTAPQTSGNSVPMEMFKSPHVQYHSSFQPFVRPGLPPLLPYPQHHSVGQEPQQLSGPKQQFGGSNFSLAEQRQPVTTGLFNKFSLPSELRTNVSNSWTLPVPSSQLSTANSFLSRSELSSKSQDPFNWFKDKVSPVSSTHQKIDASDPYNWFADKIDRRNVKIEDEKTSYRQENSIKEVKMEENDEETKPPLKIETVLAQPEKKKRVLKEIEITHEPKKLKTESDVANDEMLLEVTKLKREVEGSQTKDSMEINKRVNEFGSRILESLSEVKKIIKSTKDNIKSANKTYGNCIVIATSSPSTEKTLKKEKTPSPVKLPKTEQLSKTDKSPKQPQTSWKTIKKEPSVEEKSEECSVIDSEKEDGEISDDSDTECMDVLPGKQNDTRIVRNRSGSDSSSYSKHGEYYGRNKKEESPRRYVNVRNDRNDYEFDRKYYNREQRSGQFCSDILNSPEKVSVERDRTKSDQESELLRTVASITKTKQKVQATSQVKSLEDWLKVELETDSISHLQDIIPFPLDMDLSQLSKIRRRKLKNRVKNAIQEEAKKRTGTSAVSCGSWPNDMTSLQPKNAYGNFPGRNVPVHTTPAPWSNQLQNVSAVGNKGFWGGPASSNEENPNSVEDIRQVTVSQGFAGSVDMLESNTQETKGITPHYSPEVHSDQLQKEQKMIQENFAALNASVNQMHSHFVNLNESNTFELRLNFLNDKKKILSMVSMASVESEIRLLLNRTSFYGYPHRRVPNELLLSTELSTFRSPVEDVFLILMMPISPKPYVKLLQLKQQLEDLCVQKSQIPDGDETTLKKLEMDIKTLHDQRQAVLRSFTGYLNKKRIQKIQETVEKYTTVYEYFKSKVPPTPDSMLKYVRTTQMDLRQHLILAKQYMAMEDIKNH